MIQQIQIQNFKSINDLTLELGRITVLIGENGSGKSNILEAVAMGAAGMHGELSNKALVGRGIRLTSPVLMRAGFDKEAKEKEIKVCFRGENEAEENITLLNDNKKFSEWEKLEEVKKIVYNNIMNSIAHGKIPKELLQNEDFNKIKNIIKKIKNDEEREMFLVGSELSYNKRRKETLIESGLIHASDFLIYAPENHFLRQFEEDLTALGIRGEGLFRLLSVIATESPEQLVAIKNNLAELLDWFDDFEIPQDLYATERRINIRDRYLDEILHGFDQRSANEGFLYLLFYFTLFISDYTPKFFAIDNIDNAMNPRLCAALMRILTRLAKEYGKQVIFTTHNPSILDGLDLTDDEQRLLVVSRNLDGNTQTRRILPGTPLPGQEPVSLSEKFIRGYIGGLPKNF